LERRSVRRARGQPAGDPPPMPLDEAPDLLGPGPHRRGDAHRPVPLHGECKGPPPSRAPDHDVAEGCVLVHHLSAGGAGRARLRHGDQSIGGPRRCVLPTSLVTGGCVSSTWYATASTRIRAVLPALPSSRTTRHSTLA